MQFLFCALLAFTLPFLYLGTVLVFRFTAQTELDKKIRNMIL